MCCFSRPVEFVADTNIFARGSTDGRQFLVYSMNIKMAEDLAMILPLPVPPDSADNAIRFMSLEGYPKFFDDMRDGFPALFITSKGRGLSSDTQASFKPLPVANVEAFEASFVPE